MLLSSFEMQIYYIILNRPNNLVFFDDSNEIDEALPVLETLDVHSFQGVDGTLMLLPGSLLVVVDSIGQGLLHSTSGLVEEAKGILGIDVSLTSSLL